MLSLTYMYFLCPKRYQFVRYCIDQMLVPSYLYTYKLERYTLKYLEENKNLDLDVYLTVS